MQCIERRSVVAGQKLQQRQHLHVAAVPCLVARDLRDLRRARARSALLVETLEHEPLKHVRLHRDAVLHERGRTKPAIAQRLGEQNLRVGDRVRRRQRARRTVVCVDRRMIPREERN